jgi:hypothetical protein
MIAVNRYGTMARSHWQTWLPERYATIGEPDSFFSTLGQEAESQIEDLADQMAGDGQPGEGYLERAGRLAAARSQAEEIILPQLILPEPEQGLTGGPGQGTAAQASAGRPAVISPGHPLWEEVNAEQRERTGRDG